MRRSLQVITGLLVCLIKDEMREYGTGVAAVCITFHFRQLPFDKSSCILSISITALVD